MQPPPVQAGFDAPTAPDDATAPYDFSIDLNGDGVPDQLAAALDELNALAAQQADNPVLAAQYTDAMTRFAKRLPYAPETRARQQALWAVHERLMAAEETDAAVAIMAEMDVLRAEIALDPNFAIADRVLRQRFLNGLAEKDVVAVEETQLSVDAVVVPEGTTTDWQVFLPSLGKGGNDLQPVEPEEPCASQTSAANFGLLQRGDLLFRSVPNSFVNFYYAIKFSHMGVYNGDVVGGQPQVYESNIADATNGVPGGVNLLPITFWQFEGYCISLMRENTPHTQADVVDALDWAQERYGTDGRTRYNINFLLKEDDRCREDLTRCALYCSQLVWQIFNRLDEDVDSNDADYHNWLVGQYPDTEPEVVLDFAVRTVAPDEVARSAALRPLSEGTNPPR
ncbi:hypothetical protein GC175_06550 [bacterium]|nr:hypothetical protein [bacterium]